ncbi:hypothetical protein ACOMHN_021998 [Nucella lapillus]
MTSNTSSSASSPRLITEDHGEDVEIAVLALTAFSMVATLVLLLTRIISKYVIPEAWKISLILQDVSNLLLGSGLVFFLAYMGTEARGLCSAAGFFLLFGLLDFPCMLALTATSLLFLQNPGKLGQLSTFRKTWIVVMVVPEKILVFVLALVPVTPVDYFDTESPYPLACFPVRQEGGKGAAFGAILFFILWLLQVLGLVLSVLCGFRLWKTNNSRIHASSPNLWQTEKIGQGRALQRMSLVEQLVLLVVTLILTVVLYTSSPESGLAPQWVAVVSLAVVTVVHACMCGVQLVLWSSLCCCQANQKSKEPYQKLKKLELIKVEGPGKLRLRASWSAGRGVTKRGLVKVYGLSHLKGWAQEIVVLGMLRKAHNASLLQCLWTANTNPYFETMTMLSGQIVTAESRLICLELTNSGTLQEFLGGLDVPLPEPCTRTILHDVAEGLAALHAQNILHRNLTSSAVYLKGSVQRLVLRAAVGDFEEAQVYGSLQNGTISSSVSKKHFFLPDVRAFALVALEILGSICKRRQEETQPHHLISSMTSSRPPVDSARLHEHQEGPRNPRKKSSSANTPFCAPGAAEDFNESSRAGGKIFVVGATSEKAEVQDPNRKARVGPEEEEGVPDRILRPPTPFGDRYEDGVEYSDDDSGRGGYYPENPDMGEEFDDPKLPPITHVREAYKFEFPSQSVFQASGSQENEYEEIDDIEEEIHREIRLNALHRRRDMAQTGGYIVRRTASGRELLIPAQQHNSSFGNSDSGYVGTSSNSSRYRGAVGEGGVTTGVEDPPDVSWPKAVHKTTSANTISSFGDDILEVLPGMTDEDDPLQKGEKTLRQMLRDRDDAKVEQILEEYEHRLRTGGFSQLPKDWPKLRFSRLMGLREALAGVREQREAITGGVKGNGSSRPSTPRASAQLASSSSPRQPDNLSPRPKTAGAAGEGPGGGAGESRRTGLGDSDERQGGEGPAKRADKARPLSASTTGPSTWKLRTSFKKNKARNELARALSRGNSFAHGPGKSQPPPVQRGTAGKLVEQKYAAHNAAASQAAEPAARTFGEDEDGYLEPRTVMTTATTTTTTSTTPGRVQNFQQSDGYATVSIESEIPGSQSYPQHQQQVSTQQQQQQRQQQHQQHQRQQQQQQQHHTQTLPPSHHQQKPGGVNVGKFSSFSSSDSSYMSGKHPRDKLRDTSLTSGELTSLSSQADTAPCPAEKGVVSKLPEKPSSGGNAADDPAPILPGMKLVDSGFDEDSASVVSDVSCHVSPDVSGEACTCSCPSETVTGSETCSCDCSQCQYSHQHSGWSESQSSCGTWSNSNSFSSYDVQMHRRKLPSKAKSEPVEEHVLGPDEQYPAHPSSLSAKTPLKQHGSPTRLSPPGRQNHRHHHHHHHHHNHHAHSHSGSSSSSSAASRRYRELTKKGVPLRVTAVDNAAQAERHGSSFLGPQRDATAEVIEEEDEPDNALFQDLESQGFFDSTDSASNKSSSPVRQKKRSGVKRLEVVQGAHPTTSFNHFSSDLPPIPSLEDIIKEIPDETGGSCSGDETKAFLNRPESELSIKPLKPPAPKPPTDRLPYGKDEARVMELHREPKLVHDAELVIDRIFSRAHPANTRGSETFVDPSMGLDEVAIRKLAMLPPVTDSHGHEDLARDPEDCHHGQLLTGTDSKHVRYVRSLSDKVDLLSSEQLLPANARRFGILRRRLQHAGSFGAIGMQLLDIIGSCWVEESPPSTAEIVDQLTDHVTETEL